MCNGEGCPVGVEVFKENTKDQTTVAGKVEELKKTYRIKQAIFVGDRGMVTETIAEEWINIIGALTRAEIKALIEKEVIKPSEFKEKKIQEVIDSENPTRRYCLCKNTESAKRDEKTREKTCFTLKASNSTEFWGSETLLFNDKMRCKSFHYHL